MIDVDASFGAYPVTSSWWSHLSAASSMPMKRRKNGTAHVTGFAHGLSTSRIVASQQGVLAAHHGVDQLADPRDPDADLVARLQGERQLGDQAGSRGEHHPGGELVLQK